MIIFGNWVEELIYLHTTKAGSLNALVYPNCYDPFAVLEPLLCNASTELHRNKGHGFGNVRLEFREKDDLPCMGKKVSIFRRRGILLVFTSFIVPVLLAGLFSKLSSSFFTRSYLP